jgi:methylated-DNA-[protein]-cysteine S-methyltransferase
LIGNQTYVFIIDNEMNNYYPESMIEEYFTGYYKSEIGFLKVLSSEKGITFINFIEKKDGKEKTTELIEKCLLQLDEYFHGKRKKFDIRLDIDGTEFQKAVWKAVASINYGKTKSYKDISSMAKSPKAFRAVGNANNKNRVPIIIPCHRVIGQDGSLVGYGAGLWRKEWLLNHERKYL